jgi:hypothetical protein
VSIAAATRQAYAVEANAKSTTFREAAGEPSVESGLEAITAWIPSEAVGSYVALLGLFRPAHATARWILFGVGAALVVMFLLINAILVNKQGATEWNKQKMQGTPPKLSGKKLAAVLGISLVAYVAWAGALPGTPFLDWWTDATVLGGAAVIVLAFLLPKLAKILNVKMPSDK